MSNPVRFGQEFQGQLANPREVLVFHRSRKGTIRSRKGKIDEPELSVDDPEPSIGEKLEWQLLGEGGMSEAIETFVEKDDIRVYAVQTHINKALRSLTKGVQATGTELDEKEIEEIMDKVREEQEQRRAEKREGKVSQGKVPMPSAPCDQQQSDRRIRGSDFDGTMSDEPPPPKTK
ncbi:hypothetical protein OH77DRAFT_1525905 [Trametes cingulata]|nr:hypothetical protein OH77DRAFT_1525905 [Trametes cingulata]